MAESFLRRVKRLPTRSLVAPLQVRAEIKRLGQIVRELSPRTFVEIGRFRGETMMLLGLRCAPDATIVSVDIGNLGRARTAILKRLFGGGRTVHLLTADSHSGETLARVSALTGENTVDLLFIDGDHSYAGVKRDFEMYSPLVRSGGVVAFHDIAEHPDEALCEVSRFWKEIKGSFRHQEIIADKQQGWAGIGVLYM